MCYLGSWEMASISLIERNKGAPSMKPNQIRHATPPDDSFGVRSKFKKELLEGI